MTSIQDVLLQDTNGYQCHSDTHARYLTFISSLTLLTSSLVTRNHGWVKEKLTQFLETGTHHLHAVHAA